MMEFKTKYKIGDKVRRKVKKSIYTPVKCPFCNGKGFVVCDGIKIECDNCENGDYDLETTKEFWSNTLTVIGAVMYTPIFKAEPVFKICVKGNFMSPNQVNVYSEDQLILADEVKEGDPVDDMVKYYIFVVPNGVRLQEGNSFELGDPPQLFYYCKNEKAYEVTMPDSGMFIISKPKLKQCKQFILDHWDELMEKCSTEDYKRKSMRFQELVKEEKKKNEKNNT